MAEWKDIITDNEEQLTDEDLLKYLHENIPEDEKHDLEKKLTGIFETDALDGLKKIKDKKQLQNLVKQLHQKLPQLLLQKHRAEKKKFGEMQWIILAIILLLFLCVITYTIIKMSA